MHRLIPFIILAVLFSANISAQNFSLLWANKIGSPLFDEGRSIAVDANGNSYVTGALNSNAIIMKYDPTGNLIWSAILNGNGNGSKGLHIEVDGSGNVFVCGYFAGSVDFDPGSGSYVLMSNIPQEIFLLKLDSSGNFLWAKQMGGFASNNAASVSLDGSGSIYVTGSFGTPSVFTADFDPGPGVFTMTSAGGTDIFITKLDPSGDFVWAIAMGGTGMDYSHTIKNDSNGNILISGSFCETVDFDPGPGIYNLTAAAGDGYEIYIAKYDPSGNFIWAKQMYGPGGPDGVHSLAVDGNGNVYTTGFFTGTVDFDPGASVQNLTAVGTLDIFICKLDNNGNFSWARGMGTSSTTADDFGSGITVAGNGNVFYVGSFSGTGDFDPGPGACNFTCAGVTDGIVSEFDQYGNFKWAMQIGGTDWDEGFGIATDGSGNIYVTGLFSNTVDFDPCSSVYNLTAFGQTDFFTVKYVPSTLSPTSVTISTATTAICSGAATTFSATAVNGGSSPTYQWQLNGGNVGTNSPTYTTSSLSNGDIVTVIMTSNSNCVSGSPATSNPITVTVSPGFPTSVTIAASNNNICSGTNVNFTATPTNGGGNPQYQWQVNGLNAGANAAGFSSGSLVNGDIVKVIMTSSLGCATGSPAQSNGIPINVMQTVTPTITITSDSTSICVGSTINLTSTQTNGGSNPQYQWQLNGVNTGNNSSFSSASLANGDVIKCRLISNAACATPDTVTSNSIPITVYNIVTPTITISSSPNLICEGTPVSFSSTATNGGAAIYQWKVNGTNAGNNASVFNTGTLVNGDVVKCILTSSLACTTSNNISSNNIVILIDPDKCPKGFWAPAAFTPNHDGKNDLYHPLIFGNVVLYKFSIYNRWGQKVFESTDPKQGWDGKFKGVEQDSNVFVWFATYQIAAESKQEKKGSFMLIR